MVRYILTKSFTRDGAVIKGPILIYYYIEDFHQNHRGYEDDR